MYHAVANQRKAELADRISEEPNSRIRNITSIKGNNLPTIRESIHEGNTTIQNAYGPTTGFQRTWSKN